MTRNEYLFHRERKSVDLLYEYYKEMYDDKKYDNLLDINSFFQYMKLWPFANIAYENAVKHFDDKFQVTKVYNQDGDLIKIV